MEQPLKEYHSFLLRRSPGLEYQYDTVKKAYVERAKALKVFEAVKERFVLSGIEPLCPITDREYHAAQMIYESKDGLWNHQNELLCAAELSEPNDWNEMYARLKAYRNDTGSCHFKLRNNNPKWKDLIVWCTNQRSRYGSGEEKFVNGFSLSYCRRKALDRIDFIWNSREAYWSEKLEELKAFKVAHQHCRVPQKFSSNRQLGKWVDHQHVGYRMLCLGRPSHMTIERISRLQEVGLVFKTKRTRRTDMRTEEEIFEEGFQKFAEYLRNPVRLPLSSMRSNPLKDFQRWWRAQYRLFQIGDSTTLLTEARTQRLEAIGFTWKQLNPNSGRKKKRTSSNEVTVREVVRDDAQKKDNNLSISKNEEDVILDIKNGHNLTPKVTGVEIMDKKTDNDKESDDYTKNNSKQIEEEENLRKLSVQRLESIGIKWKHLNPNSKRKKKRVLSEQIKDVIEQEQNDTSTFKSEYVAGETIKEIADEDGILDICDNNSLIPENKQDEITDGRMENDHDCINKSSRETNENGDQILEIYSL